MEPEKANDHGQSVLQMTCIGLWMTGLLMASQRPGADGADFGYVDSCSLQLVCEQSRP